MGSIRMGGPAVTYAAPPTTSFAAPMVYAGAPAVVEEIVVPQTVARMPGNLLAGGAIISERPVSKEELLSAGRLIEGQPEKPPVVIPGQMIQIQQPVVEQVVMEPAVTYAAPPPVTTYAAPQVVEYVQGGSAFVETVAQPQVVEYVQGGSAFVETVAQPQVVEYVQGGSAFVETVQPGSAVMEPVAMTYAAAPTTTYAAPAVTYAAAPTTTYGAPVVTVR
jgi:hypothetical protein